MDNWIEPPPPKRQRGCFRGCLFIFLFLLIVVAAILFISYRSVTSGKLPAVQPDPQVAEEARGRWDQFQQSTSGETSSAAPSSGSTSGAEAAPSTTTSSSRVAFSANDLNQMIAANKKASGKAFVSIDNNVLHAQVALPLKKLKFGDRQLIISGDVHASADRDPRKLSITNLSLGGVEFPESVLNSMLRGRSMISYVDEYAQKYQVTGFAIENNQVVLEGTPQSGQ
jgi:uncharacterized protein YpmS